MKPAALVMLSFLLASCSAATIQEIKADHAAHRQVVVHRPLAETFKMVKTMSEEEMPHSRCTLMPDSGECMTPGNGGKGYQYFAEIVPIDETTTKVSFYGYSKAVSGWDSLFSGFVERLTK